MKELTFNSRIAAAGLSLVTLAWSTLASAADPAEAPDDTWITVSGTVTSVSPDTFRLDYGDGLITVEMDDWDADADAYKVVTGDKVTVSGMIDDDLFETRTIEASSVYVEDLNTNFYASAVDEEDSLAISVYSPITVGQTTVRGTVTAIPDDEEFLIDTGLREVLVETDELAYDPLDDEGFQQIKIGDRVSVAGEMDYDFMEERELVADSVVTLSTSP